MANVAARRASPAEVLAVARPRLPETVHVVADLEGTGVALRTRQWVLETAGAVVGAVVLSQRCRGRWEASPVPLDEAGGATAARLIDRSPAWEVGGAAVHMDAVVPHLQRSCRRPAQEAPLFAGTAPLELIPEDPRCRLARLEDLDVLVDVYREYEMGRVPTIPRLHRLVRRQVERRAVLVSELDGRIVGAYICAHRTAGHDMWADLTVLPSARGHGLARALATAGSRMSVERGQLVCGVQAPSNPMTPHRLPSDVLRTEAWIQQSLESPRRFPGQRRLRRLMERMEGGIRRRPAFVPDAPSSSGAASSPP